MENYKLKEYGEDDIFNYIDELPVRIFGQREFAIFQQAKKAEVAKNYPSSMTVFKITDKDDDTIELLAEDTADRGFEEPVFIG